MAQYKTHTLFNLCIALPVALGSIYYFLHPDWKLYTTFGIFFVYATLFMSPDMDLANQIKLFSLRGVLTMPFRVYSRLFSHRGISHSVLFGTMTRVIFLVPFILAGMWIISKTLPTPEAFLFFIKGHRDFLTTALSGVILADLSHLLLDL